MSSSPAGAAATAAYACASGVRQRQCIKHARKISRGVGTWRSATRASFFFFFVLFSGLSLLPPYTYHVHSQTANFFLFLV